MNIFQTAQIIISLITCKLHISVVCKCKIIIFIILFIQLNFVHSLMNKQLYSVHKSVDALMKHSIRSGDTYQLAYILIEEVAIGTLVGNVLDKLQFQNPSLLLMSMKNPKFINLKPNRYLTLNQSTGDLIVRARIDRENLCDSIGTCCNMDRQTDFQLWTHSKFDMNVDKLNEQILMVTPSCAFRLLLLHNQISSTQFIEVIVYIIDINDNAPKWTQSVIDLEIPEHIPIGTSYELPEAEDPDQGPTHTIISYEIHNVQSNQLNTLPEPQFTNDLMNVRSTNRPFSLEARVVEQTNTHSQKFALRLRVEEDLDRETQTNYDVILYAVDGGSINPNKISSFTQLTAKTISNGVHTGSVMIKIKLLDKNDHAPNFKTNNPVIVVAENVKPGTVVYQANAIDLDSADQDLLTYKIGPSATPEVQRCFRMNSKTGELILITAVNYQNASLLTTQDLVASNEFHNKWSDPVGYVIPVQVTDNLHITQTVVTVQLRKVNMNPPVIHITSHLRLSTRANQIWIDEDAQIGTLIAMINVIDPDQVVTHSRSGKLDQNSQKLECQTKHDYFDIVPLQTVTNSDFKLLLRKSLDREKIPSHTVKIECWDSEQPPLTSEASILIQVDDVNDCSPIFDRPLYVARIKEGLNPSTSILHVHATDSDLGKNAEIRYRIVTQDYVQNTNILANNLCQFNTLHVENNLISINENTGEIFTQIALDREIIVSINCTVEAFNRPDIEMSSTTIVNHNDDENNVQLKYQHKSSAQIFITIDDVNDCKPMFNESSYEFTLVEGQKSHYQIGQVFAVDCDAELSNRLLRYSMKPSPGANGLSAKQYVYVNFEGWVYTHQIIDREQTPVITFEVVATDTGNPALSSVASVLIRILDANDNAPMWVFSKQFGSNAVINISQYATVGLLITQLKAIDIDEGLNAEITYFIVHGNDDGLFEVDPINGALYLVKPLHNIATNSIKKSFYKDGNATTHQELINEYNSDTTTVYEHIYNYRLIVRAQDRGTPPRHNTTVLYVAIVPNYIEQSQPQPDHLFIHSDSKFRAYNNQLNHLNSNFDFRRMDRDLIVMIVLIVLTLIITLILIVAIFLIRCKHTLCANQIRRQTLNQLTLENHNIHSDMTANNHDGTTAVHNRDSWWTKSWKEKHLLNEYCANKNIDTMSTSGQDLYNLSRTDPSSEFGLIRCMENKSHNLSQDHILLNDTQYQSVKPMQRSAATFKHNGSPQPESSSANSMHKYNTIISNLNDNNNAYVLEMNANTIENAYTLLKSNALNTNRGYSTPHYQTLCNRDNTDRRTPNCCRNSTYEDSVRPICITNQSPFKSLCGRDLNTHSDNIINNNNRVTDVSANLNNNKSKNNNITTTNSNINEQIKNKSLSKKNTIVHIVDTNVI